MFRIRTWILVASIGYAGCTAILDGRQLEPECLEDADCPTLDVCDGPRACNPLSHVCEDGTTPLSCDDSEPCTSDSCDSAVSGGCVHTLVDADNDGYAPGACADPGTYDGNDCDDGDTAINPGVQEDCMTTADDNCNGSTADYPQTLVCYADADGDGFHDPTSTVSAGCYCPAGYIQPNPQGPDCADGVNAAHPGQTLWYNKPFCRSGNSTVPSVATTSAPYWGCQVGYYADWNYNCANGEEKYLASAYSTCGSLFNGIGGQGQEKATLVSSLVTSLSTVVINYCYNRWDSASGVPNCGDYGYQWTCSSNSCNASTSYVQQTCH